MMDDYVPLDEAKRLSRQVEPKPLALIWWDEIKPNLDEVWLVEDVLPEGGMSVVYGESGTKKTFLALDLAMHVATGRPWFGREVSEGLVIYIAAEGASSVMKRVEAIRRHYDMDSRPPFALLPESVDLCHKDASTAAVIDLIKQAGEHVSLPVRLVIVDTLARAMAGGDENTSTDMGAFVDNIGRIKSETGAHVMVIHHSGKNSDSGARGHTSLRAATDVELKIVADKKTGTSTVTTAKNRDGEEGHLFTYELYVVEIGTSKRGKVIKSAVVVPAEEQPRSQKNLAGALRIALQQLQIALADEGQPAPQSRDFPAGIRIVPTDQWKSYCISGGISHSDKPDSQDKAARRAMAELQKRGIVGSWGEYVWLSDTRTNPGQGLDTSRTDTDTTL